MKVIIGLIVGILIGVMIGWNTTPHHLLEPVVLAYHPEANFAKCYQGGRSWEPHKTDTGHFVCQ